MQSDGETTFSVRRKPLRDQPSRAIDTIHPHDGAEESIPLVTVSGRHERIGSVSKRVQTMTSGLAYQYALTNEPSPLSPVNKRKSDHNDRRTNKSIDNTAPASLHDHPRTLGNDYEDYDSSINKSLRTTPSNTGKFKLWSSKWLHPAALLAFVILFIALLLALILLWHYARQNNGLSTQISSNHYSWTYGPTALLVFVLSAWRQVDFSSRILAPWKHSIEGPSAAERSLLLDYISPILPLTLWKSFRLRDWDVFGSTLGILVLRLIIVLSTGLLILTPTKMVNDDSTFVINSQFKAGMYNDTAPAAILEAVTSDSLETYYGIRKQGLDYRYGSAVNFAYDTIEVRSQVANSTITATVNGFYPQFDCEVTPVTANFSWKANEDLPDQPDLDFQFITHPPGCPAFSEFLTICDPVDKDGTSTARGCPAETVYSSWVTYNPTNFTDVDFFLTKPTTPLPDKCYGFWSWTFATFQYARVDGVSPNSTKGWNIDYTDLTSLTCFPSYAVRAVNVSIDITNHTTISRISYSETSSRASTLLKNFSNRNFSQTMASEYEFSSRPTGSDYLSLFLLANDSLLETDLFQAQTLKNAAEMTLTGFAAQAVSQALRANAHQNVTGSTINMEQRLQVRSWIVWVMSSCFIVMIVCALLVLFFKSGHAISRDPNSIVTNAAILAASPGLITLVSTTNNLPDAELRRCLRPTRTETDSAELRAMPGFSVRVLSPKEEHVDCVRDYKTSSKWWRPLSIRLPFMVLAISFPIGIIVILEILQRHSDTHQGIADTSPSSNLGHSAASVLSSFIMIMIAMSYESIEFAISTFGPYQALRRGHATVGRGLLHNSVGKLPLLSIIDALRDRRVIVALASVAATIGSFLTIIASGLYTAEVVPTSSNITITTADGFGTYWNSSSSGSNVAGVTYGLIEHENASYPSYTYKELAFPMLTAASIPQVDGTINATMQVDLPARRASLNCTIIPKENITFQTLAQANSQGFTYSTQYVFTMGVPDSCPQWKNLSNNVVSSITFETAIPWASSNGTDLHYRFGMVLNDLEFETGYSPNLDFNNIGIGSLSNAAGCPSLAFVFGLFEQQSISAENVTAMLCIQGLQDVDTTTNFLLADMTVDGAAPPVVDERSARWIASEDYIDTWYGNTGVPFRAFNTDAQDEEEGESGAFHEDFDNFIQTVLWGTEGVPFEGLVGPANEDRLIGAIQHVYRAYMAQVISENMRVPYNGTENGPTYPAYLPDSSSRERLMQNNTSKIVLQSLLSAMVFCAVIVYATSSSLHRLLPHCPWSMAGIMSLLAGSEMCERKIMPEGAEYMTDKELETALQGWLFSLGWWETKDGQRYGIDVGEAARDHGIKEVKKSATTEQHKSFMVLD